MTVTDRTALAEATDPRFTDGQRAHLARFEAAEVPAEVVEAGELTDWRWEPPEPGTYDEWEQVWACCGGPYDERPSGHYADCPAHGDVCANIP